MPYTSIAIFPCVNCILTSHRNRTTSLHQGSSKILGHGEDCAKEMKSFFKGQGTLVNRSIPH